MDMSSTKASTSAFDDTQNIQLAENSQHMNDLLEVMSQTFSSVKTPGTIVSYDNIRQVIILADKYDLIQVFHQILLGWLQACPDDETIFMYHLAFAVATMDVKLCARIVKGKNRIAAKHWSIEQAKLVGIDVFWAIRAVQCRSDEVFRPIDWVKLFDGL